MDNLQASSSETEQAREGMKPIFGIKLGEDRYETLVSRKNDKRSPGFFWINRNEHNFSEKQAEELGLQRLVLWDGASQIEVTFIDGVAFYLVAHPSEDLKFKELSLELDKKYKRAGTENWSAAAIPNNKQIRSLQWKEASEDLHVRLLSIKYMPSSLSTCRSFYINMMPNFPFLESSIIACTLERENLFVIYSEPKLYKIAVQRIFSTKNTEQKIKQEAKNKEINKY
jgi:hypothetical protein